MYVCLVWGLSRTCPPPHPHLHLRVTVHPPSNDNVANAIILATDNTGTGSTISNNYDATMESGETSATGTLLNSVWYFWTAPPQLPPGQNFRVDSVSHLTEFDSQITVYSGPAGVTSVSQLAIIDGNDDCTGDTYASCVNDLVVDANGTYYFQVGGYADVPGSYADGIGTFQLEWAFCKWACLRSSSASSCMHTRVVVIRRVAWRC